MENKDKTVLKRKIKRNLIISLIALSILFVTVLVFILYFQKYNLLWTLAIFLVFMAISIVFDRLKLKELDEEDEKKPV